MSDPVLDALRRGDPAAAVAAAAEALQERPEDADAHHLHGVALLLAGDPEAAQASLDRAIALAPDRPLYHTSRSALALAGGDLAAVHSGLERATELDPNRLGVYLAQAQLAMARGDLAEAEQRLARALRVDGEHPRVLLALGNLRLAKKDDEGALKAFLEAAKRAPRDPAVQTSTAVAFLRRNLPDFAEQSLRNALSEQPGYVPALRALLSLLLRQGRGEDAAELAREATRAQPGSADGWALLGELEALLGRIPAAEQSLGKALELDPDHDTALTALVTVLGQTGQHDRARELLEGRLLLDPAHELGWLLRHALEANPADAEAVARRWRAARPESAGAAEALAVLAEARGDFAAAEQHADAALAADASRIGAQLVKARAELRHDPARALQRLLPLREQVRDPRWQQPLLGWLGQAAHAAGRPAEALSHWLANHALVLGPATELPEYGALDTALAARLDAQRDASSEPATERPVFLVGAPGSGVERVALLLRGQDAWPLLDDRFVSALRADGFLRPQYDRWLAGDGAADGDVRAAWRAGVSARGVDPDQPLVDWLPHFDARQLAVLPSALPRARFVLALRDPRDMLLNWLAWGTVHRFAVRDPLAAAQWLAEALAHLAQIAEAFPVARVHGEALEQQRDAAAADLAAELGLPAVPDTDRLQQALAGPEGWPSALPPGSWRQYRGELAEAFAVLAPVAVRFGYPED